MNEKQSKIKNSILKTRKISYYNNRYINYICLLKYEKFIVLEKIIKKIERLSNKYQPVLPCFYQLNINQSCLIFIN